MSRCVPRSAAWRLQALRCALALAGGAAHAEAWSVASRGEARLSYSDNYRLEADGSSSGVTSATVSGAVDLARRSERSSTTVSLALTGTESSPSQPAERGSASVDIGFALADPRNEWSGGLGHRVSSTYGPRLVASDIALGFGERTSDSAAAAWSYALSERTRLRANAALVAVRFSDEVSEGVDYRNSTVSPALTYLWSESDVIAAQASASRYRSAGGATESETYSLALSWQRALGETQSAALSLGVYRTRTTSRFEVLACPLPVSFCQAGLVNYTVAAIAGTSRSNGLQFSGSWNGRIDEVGTVSLAASRQVAPSAVGAVSRDDSLSLNFDRGWAPTLTSSAGLSYSRSRFTGSDDGAQPSLLVGTLALNKALSPDLLLTAEWRHTRAGGAETASVRANSLALALKVQGPRLERSW